MLLKLAPMESTLSPAYRPARFVGEWFPEGAALLEGYTDGQTSGGWETPVFAREVLQAAIADGLIGDVMFGSSKCVFDEARDAFVFVSSADGERLPDDTDDAALFALPDGVGDEEISVDGRDYRVEVGTGFDISVAGRTVHVYQVGNGLIWSLAPE
jgi:hypothetical protein